MTIRIPDTELAVLKVIWQLKGQATARQVRERLKPARDHATISTLLRRLESKNFLKREKGDGREFIYRSIVKPEKTRKELVKSLLQRAFDGSGIEMVQALFQTKPPTAAEIDELEELLENLKSNQKTKKRSDK